MSTQCRSVDSIRQGGLDRLTGMQGAQHDHGIDGGAGEFGGYILGNAGQPQHLDLKRLPGRLQQPGLAEEAGQRRHAGGRDGDDEEPDAQRRPALRQRQRPERIDTGTRRIAFSTYGAMRSQSGVISPNEKSSGTPSTFHGAQTGSNSPIIRLPTSSRK